jgi:hypothetical protein
MNARWKMSRCFNDVACVVNVETSLCEERGEVQLLCLLLHVIVPLLVWFCGSLHHALEFQAHLIKVKNVLW